MLSFDIRAVESKAVQVDAKLSPENPVWQQGDPVPATELRVTGRLSSAGAGRFYWHGRLEGDLTLPCRRCLADATVQVQDESHVIFAEAGSDESEDPDVYVLDDRSNVIDLRPVVREQWVLNAPAYVVCRDECKGLCPTCGTDLNERACDCAETRDSRWHALRRVQAKD
jgi:uncharacterized protein